MAKNDNVKDFCKDIADAIREKKGTSDLINPQDFSAEIKSISGGGGSEGGESSEWIFVKAGDESTPGYDLSIAGTFGTYVQFQYWPENAVLGAIYFNKIGYVSVNNGNASEVYEAIADSKVVAPLLAMRKGTRLFVPEANIDMTFNSYDDLVQFFLLMGTAESTIRASIVECSANEYLRIIAGGDYLIE